jgi:hypothetical protein
MIRWSALIDGTGTGSPFVDAVLIGIASAIGAVIVGGVVALIRFIRRTDADRMDRIAGTQHRQWHVIRWARVVGKKVGVPFPLEDDTDTDTEWDEGLK